jgi:hypothetical protein
MMVIVGQHHHCDRLHILPVHVHHGPRTNRYARENQYLLGAGGMVAWAFTAFPLYFAVRLRRRVYAKYATCEMPVSVWDFQLRSTLRTLQSFNGTTARRGLGRGRGVALGGCACAAAQGAAALQRQPAEAGISRVACWCRACCPRCCGGLAAAAAAAAAAVAAAAVGPALLCRLCLSPAPLPSTLPRSHFRPSLSHIAVAHR